MRLGLALLATMLLAGCSGMLLGGGNSYDTDTRDAAGVAADASIDAAIRSRISDDPMLGRTDIEARAHKGTVTLTGSVTNYSARDKAGRIARDTDGVVMVNNQIVVQN